MSTSTQESKLKAIADAIRNKLGSADTIKADDFATKISQIKTANDVKILSLQIIPEYGNAKSLINNFSVSINDNIIYSDLSNSVLATSKTQSFKIQLRGGSYNYTPSVNMTIKISYSHFRGSESVISTVNLTAGQTITSSTILSTTNKMILQNVSLSQFMSGQIHLTITGPSGSLDNLT